MAEPVAAVPSSTCPRLGLSSAVEVGAVYVAWWLDGRPVWRFRCEFELVRDADGSLGKDECHRLERAVAATGSARWPRVTLTRGRIELELLVRAVDEMAAAYSGLSVVDVAVSQVPEVTLGELLSRSATPARPTPATAGP